MTDMTNEQIEDAFAQVRVYFEDKGNDTGLDILNSYEEQWAVSESLSPRQLQWLEKQLSWSRGKAKSRTKADATINVATDTEAALLDAMIEERSAARGKRLIDEAEIAQLRKAISDLEAALDGLGA